MDIKYTKNTQKWIEKIAGLNKVTQDEVLKYLRDLSSSKKVIHHLDLVGIAKAR